MYKIIITSVILHVTSSTINHVGAVTAEESGEEFHEQTWFIVVVVLVGLITVTFIILMMVCVVRSVRNNKDHHEGKYNGKICFISLGSFSMYVRHSVSHCV